MLSTDPLVALKRRAALLSIQAKEWKELIVQERLAFSALREKYKTRLAQTGLTLFDKGAVRVEQAHDLLNLQNSSMVARETMKVHHKQQTDSLEKELSSAA